MFALRQALGRSRKLDLLAKPAPTVTGHCSGGSFAGGSFAGGSYAGGTHV
jgi:hypothetical protein